MRLQNSRYTLELDDVTGAILSFTTKPNTVLACPAKELFVITLRDSRGSERRYVSNDAESVSVYRTERGAELKYYNIAGLNATAYVEADEGPMTRWRLEVENTTGMLLESITYPCLCVPDALPARGGDAQLFTPLMEGCLVQDSSIRERTMVRYRPPSYPSKGWEGAYPGACPMQFFAYYRGEEGLYFASHDPCFTPKAVEWYPAGDAVALEMTMFPGADGETFCYDYDVALGAFTGDWYDAAEIYRSWLESTPVLDIPKLRENRNFPDWVHDSPVVAVYAVRGEKDTGDMSPNCYYPYTDGLPYVERLSKELNSRILALLCHWEGTAPWAPPYVWPPFGDEKNLREYVSRLHEGGNLFGVYCSGIAWTDQSYLVPEYGLREVFEREGLKRIMCKAPDQSLPYTDICGYPIRRGYDMCPACERTRRIAVEEIAKIVDGLDTDYIQFFDQFLGGAAYRCYAKEHGHPPVPGRWQIDACERMYAEIEAMLEQRGLRGRVMVGCEGAAGEAALRHLLFNDLRFNINYLYAVPVPAYSYVFNEYVCNFMGNQNTSCHTVDFSRYPDNIFYRFAHSFAQGDTLTVVLKSGGRVHWDWCTPPDAPEVDQEGILSFVRLLNAWRKGPLKNCLLYGRMKKPRRVRCGEYVEQLLCGGYHRFPSVVSTRFVYEGEDKQLLVNFLGEPQQAEVAADGRDGARLFSAPMSEPVWEGACGGKIPINLPPRSVTVLEW